MHYRCLEKNCGFEIELPHITSDVMCEIFSHERTHKKKIPENEKLD